MSKIRAVGGAALVAILATLLLVPASASPVGAAVQPFSLAMTEGALLLRAGEEPLALEQPTTITGQHDTGDGGTGAVTDVELSTPPIEFQTVALGIDVFVTASFSSVAPGTGSIDSDGNVSLRADLRVDLEIRLSSPTAPATPCHTSPVQLALDSVAPYDTATNLVTVEDADFTIPPVAATPECTLATQVNEQLAGSGNSIELTLEGDVTPPPPAGCPTITTLEVTPSASFQGRAVNLAADVVADPAGTGLPECEDATGVIPAGVVEFRSDGQVVAVADLDGTGSASTSTTALPLGTQDLTARYRGALPYSASTSAPVEHRVSALPSVVASPPPTVVIGADPVEFDVKATNTGLGAEVVNARLDVTAKNLSLSGTLPTLERWDGAAWQPVPLSVVGLGTIMPLTGAPLPVGGTLVQEVRISVPSGAPFNGELTFELVPVDPTTGAPAPANAPAPAALASTKSPVAFVNEDRGAVTLYLSGLFPHTLRQGMVSKALVAIQRPPGPAPTGTFQVRLDGEVTPIRGGTSPLEAGYRTSVPVAEGLSGLKFALPTNARTGTREVTIRYSGDAFYEPGTVTSTITVLPDRGVTYECTNTNSFAPNPDLFNVNVAIAGNLPSAAPADQPFPVGQLDVRLAADRGDAVSNYFASLFLPEDNTILPPGSTDDGFSVLDLGFGDLGGGGATSVHFANGVEMADDTRPVDPAPDMDITFGGESASLAVAGAPGATVAVTLEEINLVASLFGGFLTVDLTCVPQDDGVSLGTVTVAGTTLTVDAPDPTREGDEVTLTAEVAPSTTPGLVEFLDGTDTIGSAPVVDGVATMTTTDLPLGTRSLTAVFRGGSLTLPSEAVSLEVIPLADCPTFTDEGAGRTVRLVYLTLLRRCPDQAGYDHWKDELEGGRSLTSFARAISATDEAMGVLVDDGYRMVLDRPAEPGGRTFWADRLQAGYRYDRFLASLAGSPEFSSGEAASNAGFVTRLYQRLLLRAPEPNGVDYWVHQLVTGMPRWQVAKAFTPLDEVRRRLVTDAYQRTLGRAPVSAELTRGTTELQTSGNLARVYALAIGTEEFVDRAQDLPNP
ncbi:MAG TPA: Ig-like domain repeat protein [Iamia sp.]